MTILKKPILTEKSSLLMDKVGQYTFLVNKKATKLEIKKAVEALYEVQVISVNTIIVPSKKKVRNTKSGLQRGAKSSYKKAIVKLAYGQEIDLYGEM